MKPFARRALGLLILLLLAGIAVWIFRLPLLEHALLHVLQRQGLGSAALEVARLDARGVGLRDVRVAYADQALQIDTVDIGYTPSGLMQRQVESVRCTGVRVVYTQPGEPAAPAFPLPSTSPGNQDWEIDQFSVRGAALSLRANPTSLPVEVLQVLEIEATGVSGLGLRSVQAKGVVRSTPLADALPGILARWIPAAKGGTSQERMERPEPLDDLAVTFEASRAEDAAWRIETRLQTPDSLLRAELHGTLNPETGQEHRLDVTVDDLSLLSRFAAALAPGVVPWDAFTVTGTSTVEARLAEDGDQWQGDLHCRILGATLKWPGLGVAVEGIDADIALDPLHRSRTPPGQTIRFAKATYGAISLEQGAMQFQWSGPDRIALESGRFSWCGGIFTLGSFDWDGAAGEQELAIDIQGLDLGRLMAGQQKIQGSAEGTVSGQLRLAFQGRRLVGAQGELHAPDGTRGRLQLADPTVLTQHLPQRDARVRQAEESLRDLVFSHLDIVLAMGKQGPTLTRLHVEGRSTTDQNAPPVRLTVNIEAEAEDLLYLGRLLRRARGSP